MTAAADAVWLTEIARRPAFAPVVAVLRALAARGLESSAVAGGFVRNQLFDRPPTDVDIHYVGPVPTATAEGWLAEILAARGLGGDWDIWNFQERDPLIATTGFGYLVHFVSSIDCIFLGPDGALHDLTGRGAADAHNRTLHLTLLDAPDYPYTPGQVSYLCLEGCRRLVLHDLAPTPASADALRALAPCWRTATPADRTYLRARLRRKLDAEHRTLARPRYASFGWGAIFDNADGD